MSLELYQIIILIAIGALVGISMSFLGQTGQGVVIPIVFLMTGDILLAIATSVLSDLITASVVSIGYVKNKQYKFRSDTFIMIIVAIFGSFIGILILMITPVGNMFGWLLPLWIILFGAFILRKGFPTSERIKESVQNLRTKMSKKRIEKEGQMGTEKKLEDQRDNEENDFQGIIPKGSWLFYIATIGVGFFIGINSGMFGANSGMIIALTLIILFGYPIKKGVGTALILSIIVCLITFILYQYLGYTIKGRFYFNFEIILYLAIGSIITGIFASLYIQKLSAKAMGRGMGILMILLGTISLIFYFIR